MSKRGRSLPRILLLDDSEITAEIEGEILTTAGMEVRIVTSLADFDRILAGWVPDLVLTDVNMPDITGPALCQRLKTRFKTADVPVVLLSTVEPKRLAELARECGADGHLSKAADTLDLAERVEALWASLRAAAPTGLADLEDSFDNLRTALPEAAAPTPAPAPVASGRQAAASVRAPTARPPAARPPAARAPAGSDAEARRTPPVEFGAAVTEPDFFDPPRKVMVIDDSPLSLDLAKAVLVQGGFDVRTAASLREFDAQTRRWKPDIILTDVNMPDVDGMELCRRLKARFETAPVPVVLLSGLSDGELARLAADVGADAFISKRSGFERLVEEIERLSESILW